MTFSRRLLPAHITQKILFYGLTRGKRLSVACQRYSSQMTDRLLCPGVHCTHDGALHRNDRRKYVTSLGEYEHHRPFLGVRRVE